MILDSPIITGSLSSGTGTSMSGSFSGSFEGNGSGLTGITAEWDGTHTGTATFIGNITASGAGHVSSSITSTASFGTYVGDGSQLSGISTTPFPFVGDAVITGSLLISGSGQTFRVDTDDIVIGKGAGEDLDSDATTYNVMIGYNAGQGSTTAEDNVIIGKSAVGLNASAFTGEDNVFIGLQAAYKTVGNSNYNVIIGEYACWTPTGCSNTTAIGRYAGYAIYRGYGHTLIGGMAGRAAGNVNAYSDYCTHVGYEAGVQAAGYGNVSIGYKAGRGGTGWTALVSVNYNTAVGYHALALAASGSNTAIGYQAGDAITLGNGNTLVGCSTAGTLTTGDGNIIIGDGVDVTSADSQKHLRIGSGSVIAISGSLVTGDIIFPSTASAAYFTGDGSNLTNLPASSAFPFVGDAVITGSLTISGSFNSFRVDSDDIVLGRNAGVSMLAGATTYNVLIGTNAGDSITDSTYNVGIGYNVLAAATTGCIGNVTLGYRSGQTITSGDYNVAMGYEAGAQIKTGANNVSIGVLSMGGSNWKAGNDNICIGYYAGYVLLSGANNIMIGKNAGLALTTGDYNILIGDGVDASAVGADNELKIGKGAVIPLSASLSTGDVLFPSTASAAYFSGDGSNLTGIEAGIFSANGGYQETINNLIISSSNHTSSLQVIGSGSTIFEVQGDTGTLFSVNDGLSGELFAANDASGLSIISAHADRTVKLGKPGGFGIVISGSNPMPTDEAAKIFITGSIYHTGSAAQFSVLNVNGAYSLPQVVTAANDYILTAQTDGTTAWSAAAGGGAVSNIPSFANNWFMG
jgi:hypothetical protein